MSNLKETKRRIGSVKNTQKITKAMKLVSASKYARFCQKREQMLEYRGVLDGMLMRALQEAGGSIAGLQAFFANTESSVLAQDVSRLVVVVTADRGLCGALNASVLKQARALFASESFSAAGGGWDLVLLGKKSFGLGSELQQTHASSLKDVMRYSCRDMAEEVGFIEKLGEGILQRFLGGKYSDVCFVYPEFHNVLVQKPVCRRWLPLDPVDWGGGSRSDVVVEESEEVVMPFARSMNFKDIAVSSQKVCFEPSAAKLAVSLLRRYLLVQMRYVLVESEVCEHAARMSAMDHASQNASDVIKSLTLEYNRKRQAAITTELVEITSGAEAL